MLVLHLRINCGSLSITTSVSLLANAFDVGTYLQLSIKCVSFTGLSTVAKNLKMH